MKEFLMKHLKNDNILEIRYRDIKRLVEGEAILERLPYRSMLSRMLLVKKEIVI